MATEEGIGVRFFVQSDSAVPEQRRRIVSRLADLADEGAIGSYTCEYWPKAVCLEESPDQRADEVLDAYDDIEQWAATEGVSVKPPFDVRIHEWEVTGVRDKRLHTPHMGLAIVERGEIRQFYPHRTDDGVQTVTDGLERLAAVSADRRDVLEKAETILEAER